MRPTRYLVVCALLGCSPTDTGVTGASGGTSDTTGLTTTNTTSAPDTGGSATGTDGATDAGEEGEGGEEGGDGDGEPPGEPGATETLVEVDGTITNEQFNGTGAYIFIENDAMGIPVETCIIEWTVEHVSAPTDCAQCTIAFEIAQTNPVTDVDIGGACATSGFDVAALMTNVKWGAGPNEELFMDDGTGWATQANGESWSDMMSAGYALWSGE